MKYWIKGYLANGGEDAMNTLQCQKPLTQLKVLGWIVYDTIRTLLTEDKRKNIKRKRYER